jgi:D-alanine-D-alanine ligase
VLSVLDPARYEVTQIGITHEGKWLTGEDVLGKFENDKLDDLAHFVLSPDPSDSSLAVDVFFPVLHGTFGEDGTLQGLFELADVAYVGAGVVGSAVGMDKGVFKDVMVANKIPVVNMMVVLRAEIESDMFSVIEQAEKLGEYPLFTKPANLGSSVGVTKCNNRSDLQEGLMEAASFDRRVLIQKGVKNVREIEVSVLGNDDPVASVCGEVLPSREFYSYGTSGLIIPALLPDEVSECIREYAVRAYKAIDCAGMARVDFFVEKDTDKVYLNELNSIPGFTEISMYPKLWESSGLPYPKLVDRLIELAMERKAERDRTSHIYRSDP